MNDENDRGSKNKRDSAQKIAQFVKDSISQQIHLFQSGNVVVESFFDVAPACIKENDHFGVDVDHCDEKVIVTVDLGNVSFDLVIKIPE